MLTIYKYKITPDFLNSYSKVPTVKITMPEGANVLTLQTQYNEPYIWVLVNTKNKDKTYTFDIVPTGREYNNALSNKYIGTFQMSNSMFGLLVFHVFLQN